MPCREIIHGATTLRVVVIGAGFGGLQAAKALGKVPVHLTVIDHNNYHLFQPLLYQVATAGLSPDDISTPIRQILSKQQNTEVLMGEVTGIDVPGQRVLMQGQAIAFDYLIVATGASNNYFGHDEWQKFAPGLKSLSDGITLRNTILGAFEAAEREPDPEKRQALLTFVLVGGGPTGVELAGAMAELAHQSFFFPDQFSKSCDSADPICLVVLHIPKRDANYPAGMQCRCAAQGDKSKYPLRSK
jgi:NADH:ubiquinone reductase (H+-translocating)